MNHKKISSVDMIFNDNTETKTSTASEVSDGRLFRDMLSQGEYQTFFGRYLPMTQEGLALGEYLPYIRNQEVVLVRQMHLPLRDRDLPSLKSCCQVFEPPIEYELQPYFLNRLIFSSSMVSGRVSNVRPIIFCGASIFRHGYSSREDGGRMSARIWFINRYLLL